LNYARILVSNCQLAVISFEIKKAHALFAKIIDKGAGLVKNAALIMH